MGVALPVFYTDGCVASIFMARNPFKGQHTVQGHVAIVLLGVWLHFESPSVEGSLLGMIEWALTTHQICYCAWPSSIY